jgi:lipopolysaccharide/colanic/teichoic acid biosynthesis glycosyltransferase
MERRLDRSPDVERAAARLARPRVRLALASKRGIDVVLGLAMLVSLIPLFVVVLVLLGFAGEGWLDQRVRLGRHGRPVVLTRFRELPGGALGRALERLGARELPLLFAVVRGRLSFVGPRVLPPGTGSGHTGPRRLMAPGLIGPAQRGCFGGTDTELDDAYVETWTLWNDALMLAGRCPSVYQSVSKTTS